MARKPVPPGRRKIRIIRDALILLVCLAFLYAVQDFPILTAKQALEATQRRYLFGPGEVVTVWEHVNEYSSGNAWFGNCSRYYILRDGDWYAWCGLQRSDLSWQNGWLEAVQNDPSLPLVPLIICSENDGAVLVVCNDPEIVRVELLFPVIYQGEEGARIHASSVDQKVEDCYIVPISLDSTASGISRYTLVVRGYAADGEIIYQSPVPVNWDGFGLGPSDLMELG